MSGISNQIAGVVAGIAGAVSEIPPFALQLGSVVFYDQEIPAALSAGGEQTLAVHKYPGGMRTIDTFGPDDKDIEWSGRFLDIDAEARCQMLDTMRRQGMALKLTWSSFVYTVVIRSFTWTYQRFWQIEYQIALTVQQDELNAPGSDTTLSPNEQIQSDASSASDNVTQLSSLNAPQGASALTALAVVSA